LAIQNGNYGRCREIQAEIGIIKGKTQIFSHYKTHR